MCCTGGIFHWEAIITNFTTSSHWQKNYLRFFFSCAKDYILLNLKENHSCALSVRYNYLKRVKWHKQHPKFSCTIVTGLGSRYPLMLKKFTVPFLLLDPLEHTIGRLSHRGRCLVLRTIVTVVLTVYNVKE